MLTMTATTEAALAGVTVLSIREVAGRLECSKPHVYRLINSGALPAVDIAPPGSKRTKTRVRLDDLAAFLSGNRATTESA
jgi:excisionase family DNA binding protein